MRYVNPVQEKLKDENKENYDPVSDKYSPRSIKKSSLKRNVLKDITPILEPQNNSPLDDLFLKLSDSPVKKKNLREL
ncbi:hypothetical protein BDAP_000647 [Binucleata daphniae]